MTVGPDVFPLTSVLVTFDGLMEGTQVNSLTVGEVLFTYSLGNTGAAIGRGPGNTRNLMAPYVVSSGNTIGILTLTLANYSNLLGFGYAILNQDSVTNATTVTLFRGSLT